MSPNNVSINGTTQNIADVLAPGFLHQTPLAESISQNSLSISMFEESLQVRLEAFAFDAQASLEHSLQTDIGTWFRETRK